MDVIDGFFGRRSSNGKAPPQQEEPHEPGFTLIGPITARNEAREQGLVLHSMGIDFALVAGGGNGGPGGWWLRVASEDAADARAAIELYRRENDAWPPKRKRDQPRHPESIVVPVAFVLLAVFFLLTGESSAKTAWFGHGRADSVLLASEPWRMVTALTLHSDAKHVIGNAISGSVFGSMIGRRLGPGGALLALVASGALGNAANALYYLPARHLSIGASTAVFGAIGLLAAIQVVLLRHQQKPAMQRSRWRLLGPIAGGLALLGTLGMGEGRTDIGAHVCGFLAGLAIGLPVALALRHNPLGQPSKQLQLAFGGAAAVIVAGSWLLGFAA